MLLDQLDRPLDPPVSAGGQIAVRAMGQVVRATVLFHQQGHQALDRPRPAAMLLDQGISQVDRRGPAGTGQDRAVANIDPVGHRAGVRKHLLHLPPVLDMHGAGLAVQEAGLGQYEAAGAKTGERHTLGIGRSEIFVGLLR